MTKLEKKLARQARMTERLMGNYTLGSKKAMRPKYSQATLWNHNHINKISDYKIKLEVSKELNKLYK